jgi:hypothetical protein
MTLHEPATLVTDLLLAALAGGLAAHLRGLGPRHLAPRWWAAALAGTAVSALVGGLYHGFGANFGPEIVRAWWTATLLVICLTAAAMDVTLLHEMVPPERHRPWLGVVGFKAAAFAVFALQYPRFVIVIIAYGMSLAAWAVLALAVRRPWRGAMLLGVGFSLVAAAVQQLRIGVSAHFNHNDLYHVIQAFALIAFHRAGLKFGRGHPAEG